MTAFDCVKLFVLYLGQSLTGVIVFLNLNGRRLDVLHVVQLPHFELDAQGAVPGDLVQI